MRRLLFTASILGGAVLVMATMIPTALAANARVCPTARPGCAFTSIQAAINAAHAGDTITIAPGTYHENLSVGASVASTSIAPLKIDALNSKRRMFILQTRGLTTLPPVTRALPRPRLRSG